MGSLTAPPPRPHPILTVSLHILVSDGASRLISSLQAGTWDGGSHPASLSSERQPETLAVLYSLTDLPRGHHEPGFRDEVAQNLSKTLEKSIAKWLRFH